MAKQKAPDEAAAIVPDYAAGFGFGAPGVPVTFSVDEAGVLTIDAWGGPPPAPTVAQVAAWAAAAAAAKVGNDGVEVTLRDRADQALATLENAWANWAALTPAQKDATAKLTVRVQAGVIRLLLQKLDSAG